jgi:non-specific serine/threonine protein kinase
VHDLATTGASGAVDPDVSVARDLGDAGDVLDPAARAAYRRRLDDLREELADAEAMNDLGRIERAREEMEQLGDQLTGAARGRRTASHSERARLTVTKGIGTALDRIAKHHPTLGRHLAATVRRGYYCVYVPDPRRLIVWER